MRIGIYKDTLSNRRGADIAVRALAEGLREHGYDAVVFEKSDFSKRIAEPWDVVISTGTNELLDIYNHLNHVNPVKKNFPVIQQFHTDPKSQFKRKHFLRNWKIRRALRHVDAIQVLSERFVPQVERYGAPVSVIGNWSEMGGSQLLENRSDLFSNWSQRRPTIIYPAAFAKGKNQKLLIKAFAQVVAEFPDWRLRLLGYTNGAYAGACRRLAVKAGLTDKVELPGFCDNLAQEYERCAFAAFPSLDEGFGLVIADAAVFGKPCIMVNDWIGTAAADGGIVTNPTAGAYAEGLRRLMADADLRRRMGENAREFCAEHFSRERILDQWETLIDETVAANRSTRSDNLPHDKKA